MLILNRKDQSLCPSCQHSFIFRRPWVPWPGDWLFCVPVKASLNKLQTKYTRRFKITLQLCCHERLMKCVPLVYAYFASMRQKLQAHDMYAANTYILIQISSHYCSYCIFSLFQLILY
jgi:hypothetical protein